MSAPVNNSLPFLGKFSVLCAVLVLFSANSVAAHAAEEGFVLLLPIDIYLPAAVAVFILTIAVIATLPKSVSARVFSPLALTALQLPDWVKVFSSLCGTFAVLALVYLGLWGPRDPLSNLLPLFVWAVFWAGFVMAHVFVGNLWPLINPWTGLHQLLFPKGSTPLVQLPSWLGVWPALVIFMLFTSFSIADDAPSDPTRLANFVLGYWVFTMVGMVLFGAQPWIRHCEGFSVFFRLMSYVSPIQIGPGLRLGVPGWHLISTLKPTLSHAIFCLVVLGAGSFDGLHETFWWLARIGINPLEFPGPSQVIPETVTGFLGSIALLCLVFWLSAFLGRLLSTLLVGKTEVSTKTLFSFLAYSTIPIGLGFHVAHFFTTFLISSQYAIAALTDPLASGADIFGFGDVRVYIGFLRDFEVVRWIWIFQATVIVLSHVIAVLIAHRVLRSLLPTERHARCVEIPLSIFMILYTIFGLWLLAAARGA